MALNVSVETVTAIVAVPGVVNASACQKSVMHTTIVRTVGVCLMRNKKYPNIIELFEVVQEYYGICVVCEGDLPTDHNHIVYRPELVGPRLVLPVCDMCLPNTPQETLQIVRDYLGDTNEYAL